MTGINYSLKRIGWTYFFKDGSIISLSEWSKYDLKLGQDWLLRTKKDMERESGLDIKLKKGV